MGKQIDTLVDDIFKVFTEDHKFDEGNVEAFGKRLSQIIHERVGRSDDMPSLRMSNLGQPCLRKLWYEINKPEAREPLEREARLKFLYGDILEELLLFLAKESGHDVQGEQETLEINGVKGHRDAIIDGVLVDVKSASSFAFKKFSEGTLAKDDAFGYLDQINAYLYASQDDPLLVEKASAAFLAVDKTLGKVTLMKVPANGKDYDKKITEIRHILSQTEPPKRGFSDEPMGKSGNKKLGINCSYCDFKHTCWPKLQTYVYSSGPVYLTKVAKAPRVEKVEEF
jgi:CRISPR/Cas system-associated exonuclease Cas4 (RecB family)